MSAPETRPVVIVGAGAAGLATAIFAAEAIPAEERGSITLLEGARRIGAKILVSGGGRCNVTHVAVGPEDYHGSRPVVRNVLKGFGVAATREWFTSLGVELKEEPTGKLFPVTDSARTIVDALVGRLEELGVDVQVDARVESIERNGDGLFHLQLGDRTITAEQLVLATGGRSLPKSGSDGVGYSFARALGHTVTDTWPALVPLVLDEDFGHADLSGVSHRAELSVRVGGKRIASATGELLWTHFGISGPVALDISRTWVREEELGHAPTLHCHSVPDFSREEIEDAFLSEGRRTPTMTAERFLSHELPRRIAQWHCRRSGLEPRHPISQVPKEARRTLLDRVSALHLPATAPRGWNVAEVTAGGVPLAEIDHRTFASRACDQLSLVGEILDCEGRLGGFNFQWAWASGAAAGRAIAKRVGSRSTGS